MPGAALRVRADPTPLYLLEGEIPIGGIEWLFFLRFVWYSLHFGGFCGASADRGQPCKGKRAQVVLLAARREVRTVVVNAEILSDAPSMGDVLSGEFENCRKVQASHLTGQMG